MVDVSQSRILLTGASSGIGRELAKALGARGARLVLAARRLQLLEEVATEIESLGGPRPLPIRADLSQRGEARRLANEATEALGHVDVLVNNAGGGVAGAIWAIGDRDEGREAFEINYWSPMTLIHEVVPSMKDRRAGSIVNITSGAGEVSWPGFGGYAATKSALSSATRTLRMELESTGIHVLEVVAGPIDTEVQGETRTRPGIEKMIDRMPLGQPEVMAHKIVAALEREKKHLFYPRAVRFAFALPMIVRWNAERAAARTVGSFDANEWDEIMSFVARSGSMGHELAQRAREDWRRSREERRR
jgi:short-subunit dehydrogenase